MRNLVRRFWRGWFGGRCGDRYVRLSRFEGVGGVGLRTCRGIGRNLSL